MRLRFPLLAAVVLLLLPWPHGGWAVQAEAPTASGVYGGDAVAVAADATGTSHRYFAWRTESDHTVAHSRAWDLAPAATATLYFETWTDGVAPPALPNGLASDNDACQLFILWDNAPVATGTQHQAHNGKTCPADGASFTVACTDTGLPGGSPVAGTLRIYVRVQDTVGQAAIYNALSDGNARGALRCGTSLASLTVSPYPAGATFAYTTAGEALTFTATLTAANVNQLRTYQLAPWDSGVPGTLTPATVTQASGATTLTGVFQVSDSWPAQAATYGLNLQVTGNSPLTGVKWTAITSAAAPAVVVDDATARRVGFYAVDPRLTATYLLQVNDATFGAPPSSKDVGATRLVAQHGYVATRLTNARGEGQDGLSVTTTLHPGDGSLADAQQTATTATRGGQAGWTPLATWNDGSPPSWLKSVDVTAPAAIDADSHLLDATEALAISTPVTAEGDPLRIQATPNPAYPTESILFAIAESNADGSGRSGNAAGTRIDLYAPNNVPILSNAQVLEVGGGIYRYTWTLNATPAPGSYLVVVRTTDAAVVSSAAAFTVRLHAPATQPELDGLQANVLAGLHGLGVNVTGNLTFSNQTMARLLDEARGAHRDVLALQNTTAVVNASLAEHRRLSPEYTAQEARTSWMQTAGDFAWVIWLGYFLLTRLIRVRRTMDLYIRILADLVGWGILALPIPDQQAGLIALAQLLAFGYDVFQIWRAAP